MYFRSCIFFLLVLPFQVLSSWDENILIVKANASHSKSNTEFNSDLTVEKSTLGLLLSTVQLYEGWGVSGTHASAYVGVNEYDHHNKNTVLKLNSFISGNSNLLFAISSYDQLSTNGIAATNFVSTPRKQFIEQSSSANIDFNLGNDKDYWYFAFGSTVNDLKRNDIITDQRFMQRETDSMNSQLAWRISEDSFLTTRISYQHGDIFIDSLTSSASILSSYLGFKTRYLGSSQLSLDIGSSELLNGRDSISWRLTHVSNINDYLHFVISNSRQFYVSNDARFSADLQTATNIKLNINSTDYYSTSFAVDYVESLLGNTINTQNIKVRSEFSIKYLSYWSSKLFLEHSDYNDDRQLFDYTQTQIGLEFTRDLI